MAKQRGQKVKPNTDGTRMCVACRERLPRNDLIRLVVDSEGQVFYDRYLKAPGRGVHVCYSFACIQQAIKTRAISRALKRPVQVPDAEALRATIVHGVEARLDNSLRIGSQGGWIVSGTDVILRNARRVCLLISATDIAEDTLRRLRTAVGRERVPWVQYGLALSLGASQGREARVALGVVDQTWSERLLVEFEQRDRVLNVQSAEKPIEDRTAETE